MKQLDIGESVVRMRHVQGSEGVPLRPSTVCVLAPHHDPVRDGVVRDEAPRGRTWCALDVPAGATAWVQDGVRWRAMVRM